MPEKRTIKRNAGRCLSCGDVIESRATDDCVTCSCGQCTVDGGLEYLRRVGAEAVFEELSEFYPLRDTAPRC